MSKITLRELLNLSAEEIENCRISLNTWNKETNEWYYDQWYKTHNDNFAYYNAPKTTYFNEGNIVFSFIQSPRDNTKWFLSSVSRITKSVKGGLCEHKSLKTYNGMIERLKIELATGYRFRYNFPLKNYIDKAIVLSIDDENKDIVKFEGFDKVHLTYMELNKILSNKNSDYYKILNNIKGVYCLTDNNTGKLYIGSAYGSDGIAKRWEDYVITEDGGNKELIKLKKSPNYIKNNFTYNLLEFFDKNVSDDYILAREKYWKEVLDTKKHGYNDN